MPRHKSDDGIAGELRAARDALGLSRRAVADALGYNEATIHRWELPASSRHRRSISAQDHARLMAYYRKVAADREAVASVPRGTIPSNLTGSQAKLVDRLGLDMAALGANYFEVDTARRLAQDFIESVMAHGGTVPNDADLDRLMRLSVQAWVEDHIARRKRGEVE